MGCGSKKKEVGREETHTPRALKRSTISFEASREGDRQRPFKTCVVLASDSGVLLLDVYLDAALVEVQKRDESEWSLLDKERESLCWNKYVRTEGTARGPSGGTRDHLGRG